MTNKNILAIIEENNINKDIKWNVTLNAKNMIRIENDYCGGVEFKINVFDEHIKIYDEIQNQCFDMLIKGESVYDDYCENEVGITIAIKHIVKRFYNVY